MAVVKNLMVRAGADFSAITTQATKASKSMRGMQQSVSRSCNAMTKAVSGLKAALGAMGVVMSIAAIANFSKEAAQAFDQQASAEMRLAGTMRNTMGASNAQIQSILDLTAAQQELGVVGDDVQVAGAQQMATYLHMTDSLKTLIPVMNDLAVKQYGFNVTADQATSIAKMLGKAMEGQTGALTRYGFTFDQAQQKIMKYGTEAQKAAVLAEVVGSSVQGMNAAMAQTPTGRMQQLSNVLGDIKEQFGQAVRTIGTIFLPVLNAVGRALAGIATIANAVAGAMAKVFGGTAAGKEWQWAGVSADVGDAADEYDDLAAAQDKSTAAAKRQRKELQLANIDTLQILKNPDTSSGGGGSSVSGGAGGGVGSAASSTETTEDEASSLQEKLEKVFATIKDIWERIKTSGKNLKEELGRLWTQVSTDFGAAWDKIKEKASKVKERIVNSWENLKTNASEIWTQVRTDATETWETLKTNVTAKAEDLRTRVSNSVSNVKTWFSTTWAQVKTDAQTSWEALKTNVVTKVENMRTRVSNSVTGIKTWVTDTWTQIKTDVTGTVEKLKETVVDKFKTLRTKVSDVVEKIKGLMNFSWSLPHLKLPHLSWSWYPATGFVAEMLSALGLPTSVPSLSVSWYAKGGVFDRASVIGVGEAGREAVVPLERNTGWIREIAGELASSMSTTGSMLGSDALIEGIRGAVYDAMMAAVSGRYRSGSGEAILSINSREFARLIWDDLQAISKERGVSLIRT